MNKFLLQKNYILKLSFILFVLVIFLFIPISQVFAQPNGGGTSGNSSLSSYIADVVLTILSFLQSVTAYLLALGSFILDKLLEENIFFPPGNIPMAINGWQTIRDIANSLLILVVIWSAITIIFDMENLGGSKLLVRIIIMAILINFSFAFVNMVFGFSNAVASIFYNQIYNASDQDIAGYIINSLHIQTVSKEITTDSFQKIQEKYGSEKQAYNQNINGSNMFSSIVSSTLFSSLDIKQSQAGITGLGGSAVGGCLGATLLGFIFPPAAIVGCAGGAILGAVGYISLSGQSATWDAVTFTTLGLIIEWVTLITFVWISLFLVQRVFWAIVLSIGAPMAVLAFIVPGGSRWTKKWLDYLFPWAFYCPVFMFLLYLALLSVQKVGVTTGDIKLELAEIWGSLFILGFLIFISHMAKKAGGAVSQTIVGLGKTMAGLTVATGAAIATGGLSLAATTAPVAGAISGLAKGRVPLASTAARRYQERNQKGEINKYSEQYKSYSSENLMTEYKQAANPLKKVGIAMRLQEQNSFNKLEPQDQEGAVKLATRYGVQKGLLQENPTLANVSNVPNSNNISDAVYQTVKSTDNKSRIKMSDMVFDNPDVQLGVLSSVSPKEFESLIKENVYARRKLFERLNNATRQDLELMKNRLGADRFNNLGNYINNMPATKLKNIVPDITNGNWIGMTGRFTGFGEGVRAGSRAPEGRASGLRQATRPLEPQNEDQNNNPPEEPPVGEHNV